MEKDTYLTLKAMADKLDISVITLKRWCNLLDEYEYPFFKPGQQRKLRQQDLKPLQYMKRLSGNAKNTLEQAAKKTADKYREETLALAQTHEKPAAPTKQGIDQERNHHATVEVTSEQPIPIVDSPPQAIRHSSLLPTMLEQIDDRITKLPVILYWSNQRHADLEELAQLLQALQEQTQQGVPVDTWATRIRVPLEQVELATRQFQSDHFYGGKTSIEKLQNKWRSLREQLIDQVETECDNIGTR